MVPPGGMRPARSRQGGRTGHKGIAAPTRHPSRVLRRRRRKNRLTANGCGSLPHQEESVGLAAVTAGAKRAYRLSGAGMLGPPSAPARPRSETPSPTHRIRIREIMEPQDRPECRETRPRIRSKSGGQASSPTVRCFRRLSSFRCFRPPDRSPVAATGRSRAGRSRQPSVLRHRTASATTSTFFGSAARCGPCHLTSPRPRPPPCAGSPEPPRRSRRGPDFRSPASRPPDPRRRSPPGRRRSRTG
jgi:hypothetical protein